MTTRPLLLRPIEMKKSWGAEHWLNATRPEAQAELHEHDSTLAERIAREPALLGEWTRRLFGDELPIFTKLLHTDFPPLVHVGFRRAVDRATLHGWLVEEQAGLRALYAALDVSAKDAFEGFSRAYSAWATKAGLTQWRERGTTEALQPYVRGDVAPILERLRDNRARIVDNLHEVDLRHEAGHLLLTSAGMVHAIFGLSHQFHAKDGTRGALEHLLGRLRAMAAQGESDATLRAFADRTDLAALRASNHAPPKNEGWLPVRVGDELLLVEPQQSSDTTYSIADFYTPFVWRDDRAQFRKGAATTGLSDADLDAQLDDVDFTVTRLDEVRRSPRELASISKAGASVYSLVDDPEAWPFFTAHQLELEAGATFTSAPAAGTFQQLVVLDGELDLADGEGAVGTLSRTRPAFIPATLAGEYTLAARTKTRVLVLAVPGPHRAFPAA